MRTLAQWWNYYVAAGPAAPTQVQAPSNSPVSVPIPGTNDFTLHNPPDLRDAPLRAYVPMRASPLAEMPARPVESYNLPPTPGIFAAVPDIAGPGMRTYQVTERDKWYAQQGRTMSLPTLLAITPAYENNITAQDQTQMIIVNY